MPVQKNSLTIRTYAALAGIVGVMVAVGSTVGATIIRPLVRADAREIAIQVSAEAVRAHASNPHPGGLSAREVERLFQRLDAIEAAIRNGKKD